jgi:transcriptional/translational regulatory protein YebC/TACO1
MGRAGRGDHRGADGQRNRTAGAVRSYFAKNGGALGETGSVAFMFDRVGEIVYPASAGSADAVLEAAIEAGANDVVSDAQNHVITTTFEDLQPVARALEEKLGEPESVRSVWKPQTTTPVDGEKAETLMKLIATLEDDDDVQNVYANYEVDEATLNQLSAA